MAYPPFVAEMAHEANRPKLRFGIASGFAIVLAFAALATAGVGLGLVPFTWAFPILIGVKLVTNTLAWWSLRADRGVLEWNGLNTAADVVLMTGAIYFTGGPRSPLLPIYVIEISVVALLTNLGVTLLICAQVLACFAAMTILMAAGVIPNQPVPVPVDPSGAIGVRYAVVSIGFAAFVIGVPTFFTSSILRLLRAKERALEVRTAELIEVGKERSQFLAAITHELRTPIHGVQGLAELIATGVYGPVTDKQQDACQSIKRVAQAQLGLVDDLLALTRAEVGKLEVARGPVDVGELVAQVAASVTWMLGTKRLALTVEAAGAGTIETDRRLLGHVLVNLVANAAKFTPEGGRVTVRARRQGGALALEVEDTGIGIPADRHAAIFEAFTQIDAGDEKGYGGVGLGLALVKRLVDLLGGTIELESAVGKGSTFRVRVPA